MSDLHTTDCGCCTGIDAETPVRIDNPPGLSAIRYHTGDYARFRESLLARLSSADLPALAKLTTRDTGDFTIALFDALATTLDVLTFYQERIANENYLRTATERGSVLELARLIGYAPAPGVAASTHLAFTLQESPGAPAQAAEPVTIPVETRVQSVPGPGEQAQTFETVEATEARVEWNAIPVQTTIPWVPSIGDTDLWLDGVANQIQAGDVLLIVGAERRADPGSERWDIRLLTSVEPDAANNRTRVIWNQPLGGTPPTEPAQAAVEVHVFRQRAALFGHNAPDPRLMSNNGTLLSQMTDTFLLFIPPSFFASYRDWKWDTGALAANQIDLDASYPKIAPDSWIALVSNKTIASQPSGLAGSVDLYHATEVAFPSRSDFGLSGKMTRLTLDTTEHLDKHNRSHIRQTLVLAQSEPLSPSARPLPYPIYGNQIELGSIHLKLAPGRALAVSGKRQRVVILPGTKLSLSLDGGGNTELAEGDSFVLWAAPERASGGVPLPKQFGDLLVSSGNELLRLRIQDRDGKVGTADIPAGRLRLEPSRKNDPEIAEIAFIDSAPTAVDHNRDRTVLTLQAALRNCYERATVRVNANVARATHGETVNEILGSGDARVRNADFILKQAPLTYVSADTPSGRQSTLEVRINDLRWIEVPTIYRRKPTDRVYASLADAEARTTVRCGDGIEGALVPSGDHNVRAKYRKGLGRAGNVAAGKLSNLLTRPLGVSGVSNPEEAAGGADAKSLAHARINAPLTVVTLDRAVSVTDYRDFARAFAGFTKAHALWIGGGPARGVFLTVAGEDGVPVPETSNAFRNLLKALRDFGDPLASLRVVDYRPATFHLRMRVKVAADADTAIVLPRVEATLREAFGFERRDFGQGVAEDEVIAVAQDVVGVEAAYLSELYRSGTAPKGVTPRLTAVLPMTSYTAVPLPAELLTLDSKPLTLELLA